MADLPRKEELWKERRETIKLLDTGAYRHLRLCTRTHNREIPKAQFRRH